MKSLLKRAAVVAGAAALPLAMALPASATISPTTTPTTCNSSFPTSPPTQCVAGYYSAPNASRTANGDHMTGVKTTFTLGSALEAHSGGTAVNTPGVELCQFKSLGVPGFKAVVFAQWNPGEGQFDILMGTTSSGFCLNGFADVTTTKIDEVPAGHSLFLAITQGKHHTVYFTDSDETTQTGAATTFNGFHAWFNRAGHGDQGTLNLLTTPANNPFVSFGTARVRDSDVGWTNINRPGLTRLVLNKVIGTSDGTNSGGVLLTPVNLGQASFTLDQGQLGI